MRFLRILSLIFALPNRFVANQTSTALEISPPPTSQFLFQKPIFKKIIPGKSSTTTTKPQLNKNLNPKTKLKTNQKKLQHNSIPQQPKQKTQKKEEKN